ncbi:hypothetical protein [Streptomyces sp. SID11385]|uniref:hypothetical protein n=1 Tax=Streptomyces sp. SID11385 TaxID=2706031 RepID=UPI0013DA6734|nr:hypothetical protein [Streptomyces sp. SID11385]
MRDTRVPRADEYGNGTPVATALDGEVLAYAPRRDDGRLVVPVTITDKSDARTSYEVRVTVREKGATDSATVTTTARNVWPGTTWPTEVVIPHSYAAPAQKLEVMLSATRTAAAH